LTISTEKTLAKAMRRAEGNDLRGFLTDKVQNTLLRSLGKGSVQIAETGIEGAMLSAMNDNDPLSALALSAGAQAGGGTLLALSKGLLGNQGRNALVAAGGTLAMIQMFKEATPGGRDRILESSESAFAKLAGLIVLGAIAGAAGMGRPSQKLRNQLGGFAEISTGARRGAVLSLLSDISSDIENGVDTTERVVKQLVQDPTVFGETAQRRLHRGILNGDIASEIEKLAAADPKFKRLLEMVGRPTDLERLQSSGTINPITRQ
jgi:hypothetical protein